MNTTEPIYSYIIVRSNILDEAAMAQCAHAAQEAAFMLGEKPNAPIHLIALCCHGENALFEAQKRLEMKGFETGIFYEPDWPKGHTALYVKPQRRSAKLKAAMSIYSLWRPKGFGSSNRLEALEDPIAEAA